MRLRQTTGFRSCRRTLLRILLLRTPNERSQITTTVWEIITTQAGHEILRNGATTWAVNGGIEEARAALDELIAAASTELPVAV